MTRSRLEMLLELIGELVAESAPYAEKRQALLDVAGEMDQTNLQEFVAWFEEE